jgi:hypothetical protein
MRAAWGFLITRQETIWAAQSIGHFVARFFQAAASVLILTASFHYCARRLRCRVRTDASPFFLFDSMATHRGATLAARRACVASPNTHRNLNVLCNASSTC